MATTFTFYMCRDDGMAATFEVHEADTHERALSLASLLLAQHPTADYVNVWEDERKIGRVDRSGARARVVPVADQRRDGEL